MIVQLILHVPFQLSLMHCELGSSKNKITFDCIRTISEELQNLSTLTAKKILAFALEVVALDLIRKSKPQLWTLFTFFQELKQRSCRTFVGDILK